MDFSELTPREQLRSNIVEAIELRDDGEWDRSNQLFLQTLRSSERQLGPNDRDTLTARTLLAFNYRAQDRHTDAETLDRDVLSRRQRYLGQNHVDTAKSLNNLALDLKGQGRTDEALELEEKALQIMIRVEGEDSPTTMTSMNNLANSYVNYQRYEEALRYHQRVLDVRTRVVGRENATTIASMDLLGMDYRALGQLDNAVCIQEDAMALATSALGPAHETTIKCTLNLAGTYQSTGFGDEGTGPEQAREARAIALLEGALAAVRTPANENNPLLIGVMNNLGAAYARVERFHEAKPLMTECYEWNRRNLGAGHPKTDISRQNLEYVLVKLGELVRAPVF